MLTCLLEIDISFLDHPPCTASEFRCTSGQCIPMEKKCDRVPECGDLSDENNCTGMFIPEAP